MCSIGQIFHVHFPDTEKSPALRSYTLPVMQIEGAPSFFLVKVNLCSPKIPQFLCRPEYIIHDTIQLSLVLCKHVIMDATRMR